MNLAAPSLGEDNLVVRASVADEDVIFVRQRVLYVLDILAVDGWASLPQLPSQEISGALVYSPESQGVRLNETIDGESYSGQRYELWIYPQRAGTLKIPPLTLNASVRTFGANSEANIKPLTTKPIEVEVRTPPGLPAGIDFVCAQQFTTQQTWNPEQTELHVGEGIERTVSRTVGDVPAMVLAPLQNAAQPGVQIYPKQPQLEDRINRGSLVGHRIDKLTYVFQQPGEYELPEITLVWWHLEAKELRREVLAGMNVSVAANPATAPSAETVTQPNANSGRILFVWASAVVVVVGLLTYFCGPLTETFRRLLASYRSSEWASYQRFSRAARTNNAAATLRTLMQWLDRLEADHPSPRLDDFLEAYGDPESIQAAAELDRAVQNADNVNWTGSTLLAAIQRARRRCLSRRHHASTPPTMLSSLNPHSQ